jgi:hypothetical protein
VKAKVVSAYVPLNVLHLTSNQYKDYGKRLEDSVGSDRIKIFYDFPLEQCWLYKWLEQRNQLNLNPATAVPSDRYQTPQHMTRSNIVQHQRTTWLRMAAEEDPTCDVLIWLDLAILKQGGFTGKPVTEQIIRDFVDRIENSDFDYIPFPGIWPRGPISDTGDNWRFCGSTHIIPRLHLQIVDETYRYHCRKFIARTSTVPLDLPIWAYTELEEYLPFQFYQANHDATQLTSFPDFTVLCNLAKKYRTDKGGWHTYAGQNCHVYTPVYHKLLKSRRETVKRVLEIGVNSGSSLRMWREYFPNAEIFGIDIDPNCIITEPRIKCVVADQGNSHSLLDAMNQFGSDKFDLIVDDGSHMTDHQIISANTLEKFLSDTGMYIIEDISYGGVPCCTPNLLIDRLNHNPEFLYGSCKTQVGIGNAKCYCGKCTGEECLIVIHKKGVAL